MLSSRSLASRVALAELREFSSCLLSCSSSRVDVRCFSVASFTRSPVPVPRLSRYISFANSTANWLTSISLTRMRISRSVSVVVAERRNCSRSRFFMPCWSMSLSSSACVVVRSRRKMGVPMFTVSPALRYTSFIRDDMGDVITSSNAGTMRPVDATVVSIVPRSTSAKVRSEALRAVRANVLTASTATAMATIIAPVIVQRRIFSRRICCLGICLSMFRHNVMVT